VLKKLVKWDLIIILILGISFVAVAQDQDKTSQEFGETLINLLVGMVPDIKETIDLENGIAGTAKVEIIAGPALFETGESTKEEKGEKSLIDKRIYPDLLNPERRKVMKGKKMHLVETASFSNLSELSGGDWERSFVCEEEKNWFSTEYRITIKPLFPYEYEEKQEDDENPFADMWKIMAGNHFYEFTLKTEGEIQKVSELHFKDTVIEPVIEDSNRATWFIPIAMVMDQSEPLSPGDLQIEVVIKK